MSQPTRPKPRRWLILLLVGGCLGIAHALPPARYAGAQTPRDLAISLDPVVLRRQGEADAWGVWPDGILAAAPNIDIVWSRGSLYVMKEKGVLRRVWHVDSPNARFGWWHDERNNSSVVYDGRYVWAALLDHKVSPRLIVLDPETEQVREVTLRDGLPAATEAELAQGPVPKALIVAPLAPGRVCLAGGFSRAWVALATIDGDLLTETTDVQVRVFHTARPAAQINDSDLNLDWHHTDYPFTPTYMFTLSAEVAGHSMQRVLIGRRAKDIDVSYHPLVVDAATDQVEVMADKFWSLQNPLELCPHDGAVYSVHAEPPEFKSIAVLRVALPGPRLQVVMRVPKEGYPRFLGDQLLVVGKSWWLADPVNNTAVEAGRAAWDYRNVLGLSGQPSRLLEGRVEVLGRSHHYGLLAVYRNKFNQRHVAQVEIRRPD